jgi:thioredoxin 1
MSFSVRTFGRLWVYYSECSRSRTDAQEETDMGKYIELTDANFNESISQGVTLVDFWAPWCGPCRMVAPVIEGLADEYAGKAKIAKINVDDNQQTAMKFRVMSIPTVIVFKDGEVSEVMVGADMRGDKYRNMLNKAVPATVAPVTSATASV